ncbi:MAG: hypothetical protein ACXAES_17245, partial [Promethearchaeota archaeon]
MIVKRVYAISKRKTKVIGVLLVLVIFPLLFNPYLFSLYDVNALDDNENNSRKNEPNPSSQFPENANDFDYYKTITIDHTKISGTENLI